MYVLSHVYQQIGLREMLEDRCSHTSWDNPWFPLGFLYTNPLSISSLADDALLLHLVAGCCRFQCQLGGFTWGTPSDQQNCKCFFQSMAWCKETSKGNQTFSHEILGNCVNGPLNTKPLIPMIIFIVSGIMIVTLAIMIINNYYDD